MTTGTKLSRAREAALEAIAPVTTAMLRMKRLLSRMTGRSRRNRERALREAGEAVARWDGSSATPGRRSGRDPG